MSNETIREKADKIKKVFVNRCFFCENQISEKEDKEIFSLSVCDICDSKYRLDKELNEKREMNGSGIKWRENVRLIKEILANRCFFCERDYAPSAEEQRESEELGFLFPLCKSSCLQKYKIIKNWQEFEVI